MRIEPASTVPIFQQIADGVRAAVAAGVYRPGDAIPSVRALALDLVVNPNTIQRAYEQLEREKLIESRKGMGMFVATDATAVARNGSGDAVRAAFVQGITHGQSAGMTRAAVDRTYREAWEQAGNGKSRTQP